LAGTAAFAEELDRMLDRAAFAYRRLAAIPGIVVGPLPATSIVTFRAATGDETTDAIVVALHATGRFQVSTTTIAGRAMIRFAFLSPRTTEARVAEEIASSPTRWPASKPVRSTSRRNRPAAVARPPSESTGGVIEPIGTRVTRARDVSRFPAAIYQSARKLTD
jgi:hypothetical protein